MQCVYWKCFFDIQLKLKYILKKKVKFDFCLNIKFDFLHRNLVLDTNF